MVFAVTFGKPVTGVDATDFAIAKTGTVATSSPVTVTPVSSTVFNVAVSGITGEGSLGLNVVNDATIRDGAANPLVASFTGKTYLIDDDFAAPVITLSGSSESETDDKSQIFKWSVGDVSGSPQRALP